MKIPDIIGSIIIICVAGLFYALTFDFPKMQLQETGPAFMPRLYSGLLIFLGAILLIQAILSKKREEGKENTLLFAIATMGFVLAFLILIPVVGFYISTIVLVFCLLLFSKIHNRKILIGIPIGTALFMYLFFGKLLKVSIPLGLLFS